MHHPVPPIPRRQRGIVLMVALVMLVVITLLAIMTLGSATTEQKIAATGHFHNMGFQGAESAVEAALADEPPGVFSNWRNLPNFVSTTPSPISGSFGSGSTAVTTATQIRYLGDSNAPPHYCPGEKLGPPPPPDEIVSGNGNAGNKCFHFGIRGRGTVGTELNLSAATEQGVCICKQL